MEIKNFSPIEKKIKKFVNIVSAVNISIVFIAINVLFFIHFPILPIILYTIILGLYSTCYYITNKPKK